MSYISSAIENVVSRLKNHAEIVIDELVINSAATREEIDAEEQIPEILKEYYRHSNGMILAWHVEDDPFIRGGIVIPLLENVHNTRWKPFGILDHTHDVHAMFQKKSGDDSRVMMESLEGDEDVEFSELGGLILSIKDYYAAFQETLGFRFWQENYNSNENYSIESIIANRGYLWGSSDSTDVPELSSAHVPN